MIVAVTLDVWETMIHDDPTTSEQRTELCLSRMASVLEQSGFGVDQGALHRSYQDAWRAFERIWDTGREVDTVEQIAVMLEPLGVNAADLPATVLLELRSAYVDPVFALPPELNEGLIDLLLALKAKRYSLGLICNTGRTPGSAMRRYFEERGVLSFFDVVAFSNEEGIRKPDPEIFRRVLAKLNVPAESALHVGDNIVADVTGAKNSGMLAVQMHTSYSDRPAQSVVRPAEPDFRIGRLGDLLPILERLGDR